MNKIKIVALGGLDEDGRDLYCIDIDGDIIVISAGFKYPTKNTPGIDFIISDFSFLKANKDRVIAYILPKTKKNSFGALPYIYKEVKAPVYCTELTKYELTNFAIKYQQPSSFDFRIVKLPSSIAINGHIIDLFSTCASMPDTFGLSIRTDLGNIVYSGDFIVEYSNENHFKLDLNTLGKIAEHPTLILMSESSNSIKHGYCSPNHRLLPYLETYFKEAPGRIFVTLNSDNLYHFMEFFSVCKEFNKKIYFYDEETREIWKSRQIGNLDYYNPKSIIELDDVLRVKDQDLVIVMSDENEKIYEKINILADHENEYKQIKINTSDTFIMACPPTDSNEVIATSTVDELYKSGCHVFYVTNKMISKMHAFEEDLKMLLSLLKPKYYFPIEGYYVNLLSNAKLAFDMNMGLSHNNIFLLDDGQTLSIDESGASVDFNLDKKVPISDVMIDGIGVGDVVNEIINDRTRLSEDGVIVLACAVSKKDRKVVAGPDIQMRGFLFLKDKEADVMLREIQKTFVDEINDRLFKTKTFDSKQVNYEISQKLARFLLKK